jgi:hypothetical protein
LAKARAKIPEPISFGNNCCSTEKNKQNEKKQDRKSHQLKALRKIQEMKTIIWKEMNNF